MKKRIKRDLIMKKNVIWSNIDTDFDAWKEDMLAYGYDEDELTYERYYEDLDIWLDDEKMNLDKDVDGYIIAFATLGLWNGKARAASIYQGNINKILRNLDSCDYEEWYCDRYNVRSTHIHHDGRNTILYRMVDTFEKAETIIDQFLFDNLEEEKIMKKTKSIRPYIAKVYGW